MATATYDKIATTTLGSAASSITFSSIAASWTDLRLVLVATATGAGVNVDITFNSDTATNYSQTNLYGNGTAAASANATARANVEITWSTGTSTTIPSLYEIDVFSYASATYKTLLATSSQDRNGSGDTEKTVGLWRSTAAITSIRINSAASTYATGTTATLYGIKAA